MGTTFCKPESTTKCVERILQENSKTDKQIDEELRDILKPYLSWQYLEVIYKDYNTVLHCVIMILLYIQARHEKGEKIVPVMGKIVYELSCKIPPCLKLIYISRITNTRVHITYQKIMAMNSNYISPVDATLTSAKQAQRVLYSDVSPDFLNRLDESSLDAYLAQLDLDKITPSV
jgi:transposase